MKLLVVPARLAAFALSLVLFLNGSETSTAQNTQTLPKPQTTPAVPSERTSFQEVTSHLDPGGNFYLYLGTEQWLDGLSVRIGAWRKLLDAIPDVTPPQRAIIFTVFNVVTNLIKSSGLEDVSGFGMSSIAREKGFYHSKMMLHHYKGRDSGFAWKLFGQKPHALDSLNLLSTNTVLASFSDVDLGLLWSVIQKVAAQANLPQIEEHLKQAPEAFEKATGLPLDKTLASLGGEFGLVITLDESKKVSFPLPNGAKLELPEPGLLLVIKVKDETIFNRASEAMQQLPMEVIRVDKPNLKMRTVAVPLPIPIEVRPTLASSEGYLFLASNDSLIQDALAVKSSQRPGLKSTEEFALLSKEIPQEGNHFAFMSRRFGQAVAEVQREVLEMNPGTPAGARQLLQTLLTPVNPTHTFSVGANTDEGWFTVANSTEHPVKGLLVAGVVPAAVGAAMVLPALAKAKSRAQKIACMNNLRMIDLAKHTWALDNKKEESATPTQEELLPFLDKKFPTCPTGGEYTINPVSEHPECSIPGHEMPETK